MRLGSFKHLLTILMLLALATILLVACQEDDGGDGDSQQAETTPTVTPTPGPPTPSPLPPSPTPEPRPRPVLNAEQILGRGTVYDVAWAPDQGTAAVASSVGIWIYDILRDIVEPQLIPGHAGVVEAVDYSDDGTLLASASRDGQVKVWEVATQDERMFFDHFTPVYSVDFSPDNIHLAAGDADGDVVLWSMDPDEETLVLSGHESRVVSVAFNADGTRLVSSSLEDGTVRQWDATTGEEIAVYEAHEDGVLDVAFTPDGTFFASAGADGLIKIWNATVDPDEALLTTLEGHAGSVNALAFTGQESLLVSGGDDRQLRLWDAESGDLLWEQGVDLGIETEGPPIPEEVPAEIRSLAFLPGSTTELMVVGRDDDGQNSNIQRWQILTTDDEVCCFLPLRTYEDFSASVLDMAASANGETVVYSDAREQVYRYAIGTGETLYSLELDTPSTALALAPDQQLLATGEEDGSIRLWDVTLAELLTVLDEHEVAVEALVFGPNSRFLVSADREGGLFLWDTNSGELVQEVAGADDAVLALALSPDGQILAAGGLDRTLYLWHLGESFEIPNRPASSLETPATINGLAFNVEGTRLATAHEDNSIRVWSVEEGEGTLLSTIDASESEDNQAFDVAFTPEGDALIVANGDGTLRIWELNRLGGARDEPVDIVAHGGGVRLLAVNPADQTQFISAGADGTLRFWRLEYILQ